MVIVRNSGTPRTCFTRISGLFNGDISLAPLVLLLGFGISLSFFLYAIRRDHAEADLQFRIKARDCFSRIENRISENMTTVEAVAALVNASDYVERSEFKVFTQPFLEQNPSIQALQWIQYLKDSERKKYEAMARADGLKDFQIKDLATIHAAIPSPRRDEYYVIYYNEPSQRNQLVTGLDNGSNPQRKATLLKAAERGCATASPPVTLAQDREGGGAYLVYIPVYSTPAIRDGVSQPKENLAGFAAGVFRIDALLSSALSENQREVVHVSLTDITNPEEPLPVGSAGTPSSNHLDISFSGQLNVGGRTWQVQAIPGRAYHIPGHSTALVRFFLSILLTITLALFLGYRSGSIRKLRENEDRFRYIIKHNPNAIAVFDNEMNILHVSDRFIKDYRLQDRNIIGRNHYEVFPDIPQRWKEVHARCLAGAIEGKDEDIFPRLDGSVDYTRWECRPWRYADGTIGGMIAYTEVITERKLAEIALEEKNALLSCLLNSIPDVIFFKDRNGVYQGCNPAFAELMGCGADEIVGRTDYDLLPAEIATGCLKTDFQVFETGESVYQEEWVPYPDGHQVLLGVLKAPLRSASGDLIGIIGVGRDNTQQFLSGEALRESEARFRHLIDSLENIAVQGYSPDGTVHYWNRANESIYGYTEQEALGRNLLDLIIPPEMREQVREEVRKACETGQPPEASELTLKRKDGSLVQIYSTHVVLRVPGQEPVLYCLDIDITERKAAEDALRMANLQLEQATALAQQMAAQAESASAAKSEFLANMSHEIRTPLNGIIGMTSLLMVTNLTSEQRKFAEVICSSGQALMGLINDILDFSKIEAGRLEIEKVGFHLPGLLDDLTTVMAVKAQDKGLDLFVAADPDVPEHLMGDPNRIRQILTNLVGNAIKFTECGEVSVLVSVDAKNDREAVLRFGVRDTGIGIPEEKKSLLFESFTQADPSTSRKYGGTGLGLAISRRLVELMGGQIGFASEEGKGSLFWFTVPLSVQGCLAGTSLPGGFSGRRALLVDANPVSRGIMRERLATMGMHVDCASNGFEMLDLLDLAWANGTPYDVGLVDWHARGLSGRDIGRFVSTSARYPGLTLIMMANLGNLAGHRKDDDLGFAAFLPKPVRQQDLLDCLIRIFSRQAPEDCPENGPEETILAATPAPPPGKRILLVEDNPTNQMVALGMLKKLGLRADVAENGREALRALEHRLYDLVLMDVQMPEMNGYEATRELRSHCEGMNLSVPVIAMTANAMSGDREKCLEAGMDDYISKPIRLNEFKSVLGRWLKGWQAAA